MNSKHAQESETGENRQNTGAEDNAWKDMPWLIAMSSIMFLILLFSSSALHAAELFVARLWLPLLLGAKLINAGYNAGSAASRAATLSGFMFMTGIFSLMAGSWVSDRAGRVHTALAGLTCLLLLHKASRSKQIKL